MLDETIDFKEEMTERRRTQILLGAAKVFAEKGYHKATTKEIAQAAGVSEGTIYNYFANKRELLLAMIERLATQSLKGIITPTQPPADPKEFLTLIMHDRYRLAQERGHLIAPIIAEIFADADLREAVYQQIAMPIASYLEQYMQAHMEAGHFRRLDPMIITRAFVGAILLNFAIKLSGVDPRYQELSPEAMIEELVSFFLSGLLQAEAGRD